MTGLPLMNASCYYVEIGHGSLQALHGEQGLEVPLEALAGGPLSPAARENLQETLQSFLRQNPWPARARLVCALGAQGVSLRRLKLPAAAKENLHRLLLLQIEREFPLPPDELAWGYCALGQPQPPDNASPAQQEFLVAAVRKERIEEYAQILGACGLTPVFTLAALTRSRLCPESSGAYAMLELGQRHSELAVFEQGVPAALRLLPWGSEHVTGAIATRLGISPQEAEQLELKAIQSPSATPGLAPQLQEALETALDPLVTALLPHRLGPKLYLTGQTPCLKELGLRLAKRLGPAAVQCEALPLPSQPGRSAAILGLQRLMEQDREPSLLTFQRSQASPATPTRKPAPWRWAAVAALLGFSLLALPHLEALLAKPRLARRLAALNAERGRLPLIDQELNFLRYLKQNQPPYLDALFLLAKSAPLGSRLDSLAMNRRGDLSLRGSLKDAQQVADFRAKLIASGFFSNVTVEEQTPTPDRQKLIVRLSAQWKPLNERQALALGPTAEEIEKARTNVTANAFGPPPGMPMMPSMPVMGGLGAPPGLAPSPERLPGSPREPAASLGGSSAAPPPPGGSSRAFPGR